MEINLNTPEPNNNLADQPEGMYLVRSTKSPTRVVALRSNNLTLYAHSIVIDPMKSTMKEYAILKDDSAWEVIHPIKSLTED